MRKFTACVVALLMGVMGARYCWLIVAGGVQPALATWLIFEVAVVLSLTSYFATNDSDWVSNIANTVDSVTVTAILGTLILFGDGREWQFGRVEIGCLVAAGGIVVFWRVSRNAMAANLAIQTIMVAAYVPTLVRLWHSPENTESFGVWLVFWLAAALAVYPAFSRPNILARVYALRAFGMTTLLLALMLRAELKM